MSCQNKPAHGGAQRRRYHRTVRPTKAQSAEIHGSPSAQYTSPAGPITIAMSAANSLMIARAERVAVDAPRAHGDA
jgi:hypothetical protein